MRLPNLITAAWLLKKGACKHQVMQFQMEWPDGAEITPENVRIASRMGLDLPWFIYTLLLKRDVASWDEKKDVLWERQGENKLTYDGCFRLVRRLDRDTILRAAGKAQP